MRCESHSGSNPLHSAIAGDDRQYPTLEIPPTEGTRSSRVQFKGQGATRKAPLFSISLSQLISSDCNNGKQSVHFCMNSQPTFYSKEEE